MGTRVGIRSVSFVANFSSGVILTLKAFPLLDGSTVLAASARFVKSTIPYARIRRMLVQ